MNKDPLSLIGLCKGEENIYLPAGRGNGLGGATIPSPLGERVRVRGDRKSIFV
jgi:hypothetical protein